MYESPRIRRLRSDLAAMERLRDESSVLRFRSSGKPVQQYLVEFRGRSLARVRGRVAVVDRHEVEIKLGASYPRTMPEIRWLSPIYHPNISEIGMVCLGGYGTHWVPSLNLDELCGMLWDMARFHNYDVRSPYNRDAALWVANQTAFTFPTDNRPTRDLRAALGRVEPASHATAIPLPPPHPHPHPHPDANGVESSSTEIDPDLPERSDAAASPGARAGRYAEFVRKFASDLHPLAPSDSASTDRSAVASSQNDLILLDDVEDVASPIRHEPERPSRLRAVDEEILFIE